MYKRVKPFGIAVVIGMCLGFTILLATVVLVPHQKHMLASLVVPTSVHDIISNADIIAIGEVGAIIQRNSFSGYGLAGELLQGVTIDGNPHPNLPFTDFEMRIEKVLKGEDLISSAPIVLRMLGDVTVEAKQASLGSEYPLSFTGDRHIFLLSRNPDGTYGFYYGPWSRLIVDGQELRISNGLQDFLAFGAQNLSVNLDEFMQLVDNESTVHAIFLPVAIR